MKETKDIILKTAYNLFLYNDYEAVTINSILKATGLAKGGLYHYFASKEELFKAVVDKFMLENSLDRSEEPKTFREFIQNEIVVMRRKISKMSIENDSEHNQIPVNYLSLIIAAYKYYPGYAEKGSIFLKKQVKRYEDEVRKGIKNGEIREDIDIEATVSNFLSIVTGVVNNMISGGSMVYALDMLERQYMEHCKNIRP